MRLPRQPRNPGDSNEIGADARL